MTALPLLGVIIPYLPLFPIRYHSCGRASEMDRNTTISDPNATDSDPLKFSDPVLIGGCPWLLGGRRPSLWAVPQLIGGRSLAYGRLLPQLLRGRSLVYRRSLPAARRPTVLARLMRFEAQRVLTRITRSPI